MVLYTYLFLRMYVFILYFANLSRKKRYICINSFVINTNKYLLFIVPFLRFFMYDCIIIGGGIAGISTLIQLKRKHCNVLLLESRPFLGGRVRSYVDAISNEEIDNGQHILMNCYEKFLSLLSEINSINLINAQKRMKVSFVSNTKNSLQPFEKHTLEQKYLSNNIGMLIGLLQFSAFTLSEKIQLCRFMFGLKIFKPTDSESVLEYLHRRNINQKLITWLFEPITLATINTSIQKASAQLLVTVLEKALLGGGNKSAFVLPIKGLSHFFSQTELIEKNVKTSTTVKSIQKCGNTFEILDSNGSMYNTSSIVFATPLSITKTLLSNFNIHLPHVEEYSPITSMYLWFDKEVLTEIEDHFFGLIGTVSQWVFNKYKIENRTSNFAKSLLSIVISASEDVVSLTKEEITTMIYSELSELFPSIKSSKVIHSVVIKEKKATFLSTPSFELERLRTSTSKEGIVIAGDWTNTGLPATMEGAALSGVTASKEVLKFLQKI